MLPFDEKNDVSPYVAKDSDPLKGAALRSAMNKFMQAVKSDQVDAATDAFSDLMELCDLD